MLHACCAPAWQFPQSPFLVRLMDLPCQCERMSVILLKVQLCPLSLAEIHPAQYSSTYNDVSLNKHSYRSPARKLLPDPACLRTITTEVAAAAAATDTASSNRATTRAAATHPSSPAMHRASSNSTAATPLSRIPRTNREAATTLPPLSSSTDTAVLSNRPTPRAASTSRATATITEAVLLTLPNSSTTSKDMRLLTADNLSTADSPSMVANLNTAPLVVQAVLRTSVVLAQH
ncbi:hypothetical protein LZ32DRAFT_644470 [Colletotrichum eremochloae]|nr:hypothetical protein LZ32DRAFT_644470 [Colletotrichum eremochloae]